MPRGRARRRRVRERELDKGIEMLLPREILLVAGHPVRRHGPVDRHAGFVHGYLGKVRVVARHLEGDQSPVAVTD
jgi:hypothetical protein